MWFVGTIHGHNGNKLVTPKLKLDTEAFEREVQMVDRLSLEWPVIASALGLKDLDLTWQMDYCERACLIAILQNLRPEFGIEVGTFSGGSLAALSRFSQRVFSLDINPLSSQRLEGRFPNVTYAVGDSKVELPRVLEQVERLQSGPIFILVDGDHSRSGVLADLSNVLKFRPRFPTVVMCHDSFNPDCRRGMIEAPWASNPHVHLVELDFERGGIFEVTQGVMWGGLALAVMLPERRQVPLLIGQRHQMLFNAIYRQSPHRHGWIHKVVNRGLRRFSRRAC